MKAYELVTERLQERSGYRPPRPGGDWRCPAHEDGRPSLSVSNGQGRVLLHCQAGCSLDQVLGALGLKKGDLYDEPLPQRDGNIAATYDYVDEQGQLLFQVVRLSPKAFRQRRPSGDGWEWRLGDVRRVLYRLPAVVEAVRAGRTVFVAEGEKDVHALERAGEVATTNPGGAGKWKPDYTAALKGAAEVIVVSDADDPGRKHAREVAAALEPVVGRVILVEPPAAKDVAEHLASDRAVDELVLLDEEVVPDEPIVEAPSWVPVDVAGILSAGLVRPVPTMLARTDGAALLYPGKTHALNAEPEAGKSLLAQAACAERVRAGEHVLYVDFEADAEGVLERMQCMGVPDADLIERFHYVRPDEPLGTVAKELLVDALGRFKVSLVVIDGVAEVMAQNGWDENKNADVATFLTALPRLVERHGSTVVLIDHLVKDREGQGRYARGAGHKLAGISGAAYRLELVKPFGRGMAGLVRIMVTKDRPGSVRPHAHSGKVAEMRVVSDGDSGRLSVTLEAPETGDFRPTNLMEKISRVLEIAADPLSVNDVLEATRGNRDARLAALRCLVEEGYAAMEAKGQAHLHRSVRPFREDAGQRDPGSEEE